MVSTARAYGPIIYGPVDSWRLGRSLGIDILAGSGKYCNFDCVYCQLGESTRPVVRRREFVTLDALHAALAAVHTRDFDFATFSGSGEPTLASNLAPAIDMVKKVLQKPVAVLTNAALLTRDDVRRDLARADVVLAKIDAPDEATFRHIDRPWQRTTIREIVDAIKLFKTTYLGRLALQMMFIAANRRLAPEMASIAREIGADEVYLGTPVRSCPTPPLSREEMAQVRQAFVGINGVHMVYDSE